MHFNPLIVDLGRMHFGCYIDGNCVKNISYADDMVPTVRHVDQYALETCARFRL